MTKIMMIVTVMFQVALVNATGLKEGRYLFISPQKNDRVEILKASVYVENDIKHLKIDDIKRPMEIVEDLEGDRFHAVFRSLSREDDDELRIIVFSGKYSGNSKHDRCFRAICDPSASSAQSTTYTIYALEN